jgi:inorganic pyrophosphatase
MFLDAIPAGRNPPSEMNVLIEVPLGGEPIKYELDEKAAILVVDRFLYTPMRYPGNYGFIPHTLSGDGDPCDAIVANAPAVLPGTLMSCKVIGVLFTRDEAGFDEKIVAVPSARLAERSQNVENYFDLPAMTLRQIEHFFCHYKDLDPGKWVKVERWGNAEEARRTVAESIERAKQQK